MHWRVFFVLRFSAGDDEGVEHEVAPWAEVEYYVDRLGDMAVSTLDAQHVAAVSFKEEFYLDAVGRDDRVVVRFE